MAELGSGSVAGSSSPTWREEEIYERLLNLGPAEQSSPGPQWVGGLKGDPQLWLVLQEQYVAGEEGRDVVDDLVDP